MLVDGGHPGRRLRVERIRLRDGARTTAYVAAYPVARTEVRIVRLATAQPLPAWCASEGELDALVGGFYARPGLVPLGELRQDGTACEHVPFTAPWDAVRACVHVDGGRVVLTRRDALPRRPTGDLLQAGPLLVRDGVAIEGDREGFSAGAAQFDSDITIERHPRAALGLTADGRLLAVACDGRAAGEAGLLLDELAELLVAHGAHSAINLDGGGSTSLVCGGELVNSPREGDGTPLPGGRAVSTALLLRPR